uniref:Uncharacterized protein n=1 Tax=Anguilla anguilla TaxID=7936 RepID=A0A0E9XPX0_ANGAN
MQHWTGAPWWHQETPAG